MSNRKKKKKKQIITWHKKNEEVGFNLLDVFLVVLALYAMVYLIFYGHSYGLVANILYGLFGGMLFLIFLYFYFTYLEIKGKHWWQKTLNGFVFIGFLLGSVAILFFTNDLYKNKQLEKYGTIVTAKVIGNEYSLTEHELNKYATLMYNYNNTTYFQRIENDNNYYNINDNIQINISTEDPELMKLVK